MQKNNERPVRLLTAVQCLLCAAMVILGGAWGFLGLIVLVMYAFSETAPAWLPWLQGLSLTVAAGCLMWVLAEAFGLCGRIKRETAFTERNAKALGHIVAGFTAAAVATIPVGELLMTFLLPDGSAWAFLPAFVCIMAALLVRAVQLLLRRAAVMQDENDLTV